MQCPRHRRGQQGTACPPRRWLCISCSGCRRGVALHSVLSIRLRPCSHALWGRRRFGRCVLNSARLALQHTVATGCVCPKTYTPRNVPVPNSKYLNLISAMPSSQRRQASPALAGPLHVHPVTTALPWLTPALVSGASHCRRTRARLVGHACQITCRCVAWSLQSLS